MALLIFVLLQLTRLLFGLVRVMKLKQQAEVIPSVDWGPVIDRTIRFARYRRPVAIAVSDQISMPFVVGYLQPTILFPRYLVETLHPGDIRKILLHEMAHVERFDDWGLLIQRSLEAFYAFHPLVRYVARQIDLQREMACDDRVLASLPPQVYASCLTRVAELTGARVAAGLSVSFLQGKTQLSRRLESLLDRTREHMPALSARYLVSFAGGAALFVVATLNTPGLLAYSMSGPTQSAAPAQAAQGDSEPERIDLLVISPGDGENFSYQDYGDNYQNRSGFPKNAIIYRKNGAQRIIRDSKVLSEAQSILRPQQELGQQQAVLGAQQAKLGEAQAALGAKQAALLANWKLESVDRQALQQQLRSLEDTARALAADRSEKTASEMQQQLADLQGQLGQMQSRMGQQQSKHAGEQEKLGELQSQLGEQQAHLGAKQGELGSAQAHEAKIAQGKLRDLIRRAEAQHLSQPLP